MVERLSPSRIAQLDQHWAEVREWYLRCEFSDDEYDRLLELLYCDLEEIRGTATDRELDAIQRIACVGFWEMGKRVIERVVADDEENGV